jgi:hypothetical protein
MITQVGATNAGASRWKSACVCAVAGLAMLVWTWRRWPDVLVDFGGEIYVPWRLREGDVLYRDVAYFTGPLSPYIDALWFRLFGTSLITLALANVGVIVLIAVSLLHLLERASDHLSAVAATVVFLTLFAFAQLEVYGNSNYVTPYAHETTHGTLNALAAITCLERWMRTDRRIWIAALGLLLGLSFLTKVEYFLATSAACAIGMTGWMWSRRTGVRSAALTASLALGSMLVAPVLAFGALCTALDAGPALRGVLGAWPYVIDSRITSLRFYTFVMGTDRPLENLRLLAQWTLPHAVVVGAALALAFALRKRKRSPAVFGVSLVATSLVLLTVPSTPRVWLEAFRPLPLFVALALAASLAIAVRDRRAQDSSMRALLQASLCTYALVLIGKMVLNARLQGYGYALAMPAMMVFCVALTSWIPRAVEARGGNGALVRGAACGILAAAIVSHLVIMHGYFAVKTVEVGRNGDAFFADARGKLVNDALDTLEARMKPGDTLAVLPEGVMLNYLLRKKAPARYINYMPPEVLMFGEENMLSDFAARPPDWIVLAHKSTAEYGLSYFGQDYGQRLFAWIAAHYENDASFGDPPLQRGTRYGIRILRRKV